MALYIPQWANEDGRLHVSDDDANVEIYPYVQWGTYKLTQSGVNVRANTTFVTGAVGSLTGKTVFIMWDGIAYFIPGNTAVSVPGGVYQIAIQDPNLTVT